MLLDLLAPQPHHTVSNAKNSRANGAYKGLERVWTAVIALRRFFSKTLNEPM